LDLESTGLPISPSDIERYIRMGIQSRLSKPTGHGKYEESLPLNTNDDQFKDHSPRSIANHLKTAGITLALLFACFTLWSNTTPSSRGLDFPWPKPDPVPAPSFIAEGIKQCGIISRPPPSHKPATSARKISDRFVKGTRAVWLKNGTVWTGGKGGEEVLYGVDVLMDGGVVRQVGKAKDIKEMVKKGEVDELELNGAWVTPGKSNQANLCHVVQLPPYTPMSADGKVLSTCTLILEWTLRHLSREQTIQTRSKPRSFLGSGLLTVSIPMIKLSIYLLPVVSQPRSCFQEVQVREEI
jgi:hypothetical protein